MKKNNGGNGHIGVPNTEGFRKATSKYQLDEIILQDGVDLRKKLHEHGELSGEEKETKKMLMEFLKDKTNLDIVDRGKWFCAKYKSKNTYRSPIALRADFDAIALVEDDSLPYHSKNRGVAHKCGHDGHSASLATFARLLENAEPDRDVYLVFQHGEEAGIGGEPASQILLEEGIPQSFAVHNLPGAELGTLCLRKGTINCASKGIEIKFTGVSSHASEPEKGKNPTFAISKLALEVEQYIGEGSFKGILLATVVGLRIGSRAFGISAHKGEILYTIRGEFEDEYSALESFIKEKAEGLARTEGLDVEFSYQEPFPATINHGESIEKISSLAEAIGIECEEIAEPIRSSEDFGYFLQRSKGALVWMGAGKDCPPLHSPQYDFRDELIPKTCEFFAMIVEGM